MIKKTVVIGLEIDTVISCLDDCVKGTALASHLLTLQTHHLQTIITINDVNIDSIFILSINDVINIHHSLIIINFDDNFSLTCVVLTILYIL